MKTKKLLPLLLLLVSVTLVAQNEMDAFRYSQTDLNGTARSMSMGGAFGALGGDMSVMSHNPGGLAIYRSSEIQSTLNIRSVNNRADWNGMVSNKRRGGFHMDNFSYVSYRPTGYSRGVKSFNLGVAYNRVKNFKQSYKAVGKPEYSMADYTAARASSAYGKDGGVHENDLIFVENQNDPYINDALKNQWLSVLGYESGFFSPKYDDKTVYQSEFGEWQKDVWAPYKPDQTLLTIKESGYINEFNFAGSMNISDRIFLGLSLNYISLKYELKAVHEDQFGAYNDYLLLNNSLAVSGDGFSVNLGVVVRPVDFLRFGVAYNSPKWTTMREYYYANTKSYNSGISGYPIIEAGIPKDLFADYKLNTPERWIFSGAAVIGQFALFSVDYELVNFQNMRLLDFDFGQSPYKDENDMIKDDFGSMSRLKMGAEVKLTPRFALRAGYVWESTPMKSDLTSADREKRVEVFPSGMVPHYTVLHSTNYFTGGLGYRFTPNFYVDMAYIHKVKKEQLYPFGDIYWENKDVHAEQVEAAPIDITKHLGSLAVTFGFKF